MRSVISAFFLGLFLTSPSWAAFGFKDGQLSGTAMDCTGAKLLFAIVTDFSHSAATDTVTDTQSNTWTAVANSVGGTSNSAVFYVNSTTPSVSGSMTLTVSGGAFSIAVGYCFTGTPNATILNGHGEGNVNQNVPVTIQPGSVTPSANGAVCGTGVAATPISGSWAVDGLYATPIQQIIEAGASEGIAASYWIQTTATATNPTWTLASGALFDTGQAAVIACFALASAGTNSLTPARGFTF